MFQTTQGDVVLVMAYSEASQLFTKSDFFLLPKLGNGIKEISTQQKSDIN